MGLELSRSIRKQIRETARPSGHLKVLPTYWSSKQQI